MAGHSKFKNIQFRKGAQDAKRAKRFAKLAREITVACKMGAPDPDQNPRLRGAIQEARKLNMPKDRIQRAMSSGDDDGSIYEEIRYEGYGPGSTAVIVEALTDNRNRTAAEVRAAFTKHGGNMGETNSVSFNFERCGMIRYNADAGEQDAVFEAALDAGAQDVESDEDSHTIYCEVDDFNAVKTALEESLGEPEEAYLDWKPLNTVDLDVDQARTAMKFVDVLEDNDDVQRVFVNYEISDDVAEKLDAE